MKATNTIRMNLLRKHRTKLLDKCGINKHTPSDVDKYIKPQLLGAYPCFDGDAEYYRMNVCEVEFGEDEFHDIVDEYRTVFATIRDYIDGCISDEEDEMQDAFLCELEYQLNNK